MSGGRGLEGLSVSPQEPKLSRHVPSDGRAEEDEDDMKGN